MELVKNQGTYKRPFKPSPLEIKKGDEIRIFTKHDTDSAMYVRQGIVSSIDYSKKCAGKDLPALLLSVRKVGQLRRGNLDLQVTTHHKRAFTYGCICLIEKLESGHSETTTLEMLAD